MRQAIRQVLTLAMLAVFLALFKDWTPHLSPGERGTVLVLAADRKQAQSIMRYARAFCEEVPLLAAKIERVTSEELDFKGRVSIEVGTASYRTVRGRTLIAGLLDELAFFRSEESSNPDYEIVEAIKPALASMPGSMLFFATSPHSRRGVPWETYRRWYGVAGAPCLVWQAPTRVMNPTIPQATIDDAYERDPQAAAAEFGAQFRSDIAAYVSREVVDAATMLGRRELLPASGIRYTAFVDPSGGSADSMTLAIAHRDSKDRTLGILDCVREVRPPFSPEAVVADFVQVLKTYGISKVTGDRYGGEWCREPFRKLGITYEISEKSKGDIYQNCLPLLNSGKVELLDLPKLSAQFIGLERRTARGGKESIDHAPGGHDDLVNSVTGALLLATSGPGPMKINAESLRRLLASPPMPGSFNYGRRGPDPGRRIA